MFYVHPAWIILLIPFILMDFVWALVKKAVGLIFFLLILPVYGEEIPAHDLLSLQRDEVRPQWIALFNERYKNLDSEDRPTSEAQWTDFIKVAYTAKTEQSLFDSSRVDLYTPIYAFEVDWSNKTLKWAESIGQSLWYATATNKKPAVLLLVPLAPRAHHTDSSETAAKRRAIKSNIHKAVTVCNRAGIRLELINLYEITRGTTVTSASVP